ncbi:hypothetical protein [Pseudomonas sp.]|uniref:hypothetical protein n=1 Tax=Pseudomonas sp. TaxID=306 RepID=UPI0035622272
MPDPIALVRNPEWMDASTRPACKYSPVVVHKAQTPGAIVSMQDALKKRIAVCKSMAGAKNDTWFSFLRAGPSHEPHLRSSNVPVIVISGGSAKKLAIDLCSDYSLAWHPINLRNEPLYLLVHKLDFNNYAQAMSRVMAQFRNMHLIGWSGGGMTGFGAARAAALAFADTLPYRPQRILMMDQDVIQTEVTRHTNPIVQRQLDGIHQTKRIAGLGVGYPTRVPVPKQVFPREIKAGDRVVGIREPIPAPNKPDFNSPAQQFVSIQAPFRKIAQKTPGLVAMDDGIYPAYMVGGGEDMLMGMQQQLNEGDENAALLPGRILKKALPAKPQDKSNEYWNTARVNTLAALYAAEKDTRIDFEGKSMTIELLIKYFFDLGCLTDLNGPDAHNASACIIERIILRLHKLGAFPADVDGTVFSH